MFFVFPHFSCCRLACDESHVARLCAALLHNLVSLSGVVTINLRLQLLNSFVDLLEVRQLSRESQEISKDNTHANSVADGLRKERTCSKLLWKVTGHGVSQSRCSTSARGMTSPTVTANELCTRPTGAAKVQKKSLPRQSNWKSTSCRRVKHLERHCTIALRTASL